MKKCLLLLLVGLTLTTPNAFADGDDEEKSNDDVEDILPQTGTEPPIVFYVVGLTLMLTGFVMVRYARKAI
jgi:LPXTG-motif cell wall-anchored protein